MTADGRDQSAAIDELRALIHEQRDRIEELERQRARPASLTFRGRGRVVLATIGIALALGLALAPSRGWGTMSDQSLALGTLLSGPQAARTWPISISGSAANALGLQGTPVSPTRPGKGQVLALDPSTGLWTPADGPLVASVSADAFLSEGPRVTAVTHVRTGVYVVQFDTSVGACVRVASLGHTLQGGFNAAFFDGDAGEVNTFNGFYGDASAGGVGVATRDSAGNLADRDFHLVVVC